jgi:hypothetical protein
MLRQIINTWMITKKIEESNYIMYWDANNLYGWAMSQHLPYKDLKFDNDVELETDI